MTAAGPPPVRIPIPLADAELTLIERIDWGSPDDVIISRLTAGIPWRQESIALFGKAHLQPRLICWMGDPGCRYRYSGRTYEPVPWHPLVADLRTRIERQAQARFNAVLLNLYRDGQDSIGCHADDEPELGERPIIASLSFGAERTMYFRHRHDSSIPIERISLPGGSLLVMRGDTQVNWKHAIPKTRKPVGPRINLTFRRIVSLYK